MKKIIGFQSKKEHYEADACVVWCFDDRFTAALERVADFFHLKNYDLVKIAGGAKSLASPEKEWERKFLLKQILISINLHKAAKVIIMNHSDCGAYGGTKMFGEDAEKEREFHEAELLKAKEFLRLKISKDIEIKTLYLDFNSIHATIHAT